MLKSIEEKAKLTLEFIKTKAKEYNHFKNEIEGFKFEANAYKNNLNLWYMFLFNKCNAVSI